MRVGSLVVLALLGACGGSTVIRSTGGDAGGTPDATTGSGQNGASSGSASGGSGGPWAFGGSGGSGGSSGSSSGAWTDPQVLPPSIPCASTGPACPSPPPACAGPNTAIVYQGNCNSGTCAWQAITVNCPNGEGCAGPALSDAGLDVPAVDGSAWINANGCQLPAPPSPAPVVASCDVDASPDASVCPPPASTCLDSDWLVYYDDGQCVAGQCAWQQRDHFCRGSCRAGACVPLSTTAPPIMTTVM